MITLHQEIILDIHGEYANALSSRSNIYKVNLDEYHKPNEKLLHIPYWAMNYDEFMDVTLGELQDKDRGAVLEKITEFKLEALEKYPKEGVNAESITVDTPIPFSINRPSRLS